MGAAAQARSFLFVPGSRPDRFARALGAGADCTILDLEDAIAPQDKGSARDAVAQGLAGLAPSQLARTWCGSTPPTPPGTAMTCAC